MLDISIRQLESFAATAEYSSFTRAAQELHLTQSTVSMHIQSLEDILGTQLIVRGARKRFSLTEDGKRVYAAAKDILSRCEALQQMRQGLESEALSIGTSTVPAQPDVCLYEKASGCALHFAPGGQRAGPYAAGTQRSTAGVCGRGGR